MTRKVYYNPKLDPGSVAYVDDGDYQNGGPLEEPTDEHPANLISSLCDDGCHAPALDIDIPCRILPSRTRGHSHLYFDSLRLTWPQYATLLQALSEAGIIEVGYMEACLNQGQSVLRAVGARNV